MSTRTLFGVVALVAATFILLRNPGNVANAVNDQGEIVVLEGDIPPGFDVSLQSARRVETLSELPPQTRVIVLSDSQLGSLGATHPNELQTQLLKKTTLVALNVPLADLLAATSYVDLMQSIGMRPEGNRPLPPGVPDAPFFSYVNVDYDARTQTWYSGMGVRESAALDIDLERFLTLTEERAKLRAHDLP